MSDPALTDKVPPTPAAPNIPTAASRHGNPLISVLLNEAGLDSPTFRSNALHFADQVDAIERWLEGYSRTAAKLSHDMLGLEAVVNDYLSKIIPPQNVVSLDHDYTALALKRISEGSREWWTHILGLAKKMDTMSAEPIRNFLQNDLRSFKETRRNLEQAQKTFDTTLARYLGQSKTKEPSAIREDAFAVYETRKVYLKTSMDFCQMAPQLRFTLDKLLVRVSSDIWREMKRSKDTSGSFGKWGQQMDRVRGWSKEMELTESTFKRELQAARREVGESSLVSFRPSRELDAYSASTVPFLGSKGPLNVNTDERAGVYSEKQGWLFLRTLTGKPVRTTWIRRWYYCRDGIFGWMVSGPQGVLTGDEIGVLLCNAKPAISEERRFCFEVKTKNQTLLLQAETQSELMGWLEVFEVAKKKAFEASVGRDTSSLPGGVDPAFAITPPSMPEFSAKSLDAQLGVDEVGQASEKTNTLPVPGQESGGLIPRASFDVGAVAPRRSATSLGREEGESGRDHAARIMQKLDLHRKANFSSTTDTTAGLPSPGPSGGIASLISASHGLLPGYPSPIIGQAAPRPQQQQQQQQPQTLSGPEPHAGSLAPATLASPPAPTSLSKTAVVYSSDRSLSNDSGPGLPTAIMANYWGSNAWAHEYAPKVAKPDFNPDDPFGPNSPSIKMSLAGDSGELKAPTSAHKKAISMDAKIVHPPAVKEKSPQEQFPSGYPLELKTNTAQFRLVFPSVPMDEKLVLVFRASWTTSTSERSKDSPGMAGNGRIYVTPDNMYFYGHQMGLVVAYAISLDNITEVTAAPGRDCDFIFLHLSQDAPDVQYSRISIKTFLEDMDLLHARLNLLVDDLQAEEPMEVMELINALINFENEEYDKRSPSAESWEEVSANTPVDNNTLAGRAVSPRADFAYKSRLRSAKKPAPKLQLPAHPVHYEPEDMQRKVAERTFEISAKACFHVLFGDKSFVFPKLYFERRAKQIAQGPWTVGDAGRLQRSFQFKVKYGTIFRQTRAEDITDHQTIEIFSDHVTYVVTHVKTPWHLPHAADFKLVTKIVITHIAKSKCKLAIFTKVAWSKAPALSKNIVERQALDDAVMDAEELAEVATDQVRKIGPHSRTKRAIQIYGNIGQQTQVVLFSPAETEKTRKTHIRPHSLTSMLFDTIRSFTESAVTSVIMWAFAVVKKLWDVITAQRIMLIVLALSAVFNVVLSSQGASTWWSERRAAGFMNRLGVGPNIMMSKAIYLRDLDEAARFSSIDNSWPAEDSYCYSTFQSIANSTDIDAPFEDSGAGLSSATSRATARRLRRSRQRLGAYRHDLLVAMRMVNSVEREMIQGEWENWLLDENLRCEQVGGVLRLWNSTSTGGKAERGSAGLESEAAQKLLKEKDDRKKEALKSWYQDYCGSCRQDKDELIRFREGLSIGHVFGKWQSV
ncbi:putative PH domain-containing protein [Seiridium cardinale]|uniref:PH domain-containing protein n=1 Tax=Seiridium cardinale TaxID=138064 RepID=A0ABR2XZU0_9PEZI